MLEIVISICLITVVISSQWSIWKLIKQQANNVIQDENKLKECQETIKNLEENLKNVISKKQQPVVHPPVQPLTPEKIAAANRRARTDQERKSASERQKQWWANKKAQEQLTPAQQIIIQPEQNLAAQPSIMS